MVAPKKSLGQHWLYDIDVLTDIAEMAEIVESDTILEIGPGLGTLTEVLLSYSAHVVAVEYDENLYDRLRKTDLYFKDTDRLKLVNQDILQYNLNELPKGYKVVANIPYYLTSNLVRVLSESSNPPFSATLLVQKEVAERICAKPGQMSILGVSAQMYFQCSLGPIVPSELFTPPPKVDSQIVHLAHRQNPLFGEREATEVFRVIKAGFSNKRKTLLNSLSAGLHISKREVDDLLASVGISPTSRPQELSLQQWLALYDEFIKAE